jgi:hypothetical protein
MRNSINYLAVALGIVVVTLVSATCTSAKTVRECNDEYAANKAAIQGSGQKKKDFITACRVGGETSAPGAATAPLGTQTAAPRVAPEPAAAPRGKGVKTVRECDSEYATNKAAIQGSGQKKKDFITACRAGSEVIPGGPAAVPSQSQSAAPRPAPAPSAAPPVAAPTPPPAASAPTASPPPTTRTAAPPVRSEPGAAIGAGNQFAGEAQAKASCPGDTVVWVNARSGVYHFAGFHNYGTTKNGAYMCERAAIAAGNRAPKNEQHP